VFVDTKVEMAHAADDSLRMPEETARKKISLEFQYGDPKWLPWLQSFILFKILPLVRNEIHLFKNT
jgi:hypothetical protein